jgi:hypothetical protein
MAAGTGAARRLRAPSVQVFFYGNPGDIILAADWDGDGDDTVAVYRPSNGRLYVNLNNGPGAANYTLYVWPYAAASRA